MKSCGKHLLFDTSKDDHLVNINSKILEVKKKIQLSEGQRKSHYEENEAEKKLNRERIEQLKNEIKQSYEELAICRSVLGDDQVKFKKYLENLCPIGNKTPEKLLASLDEKVIESRKQLDLLRYERRKKKTQLDTLEKQYEKLLIENNKSSIDKIDDINPIKRRAYHLENEIHRISVQWNEAELVKKKYLAIRNALLTDASKFERSLNDVQEIIQKQNREIQNLQIANEEAVRMRSGAVVALSIEQANVTEAEELRQHEVDYFQKRFEERRRELELIEKRIFPPTARIIRQDSNISLDQLVVEEDEEEDIVIKTEQILQSVMKVVGVTEPNEILDKFEIQKETSTRLHYLRNKTEEEKLKLEDLHTALLEELESFKFADLQDNDLMNDQMKELKANIEKEYILSNKIKEKLNDTNTLLTEIKKHLYDLSIKMEHVNDPCIPTWTNDPRDVRELMHVVTKRYQNYMELVKLSKDEPIIMVSVQSELPSIRTPRTIVKSDEENVPVPTLTYKDLINRDPKINVSDEEEEIPSRSYLKRQAQLIVDTKLRRKGGRFPYRRK